LNLGLAVNETDFELVWDDVSENEDGFRIYRSAFSDPYELVAELGPDATTFNDGNIDPGIEYTYYIVAFNSGGESGPSNEVTGELPAS
jgi:fibronectin type 3 domain-containing protein